MSHYNALIVILNTITSREAEIITKRHAIDCEKQTLQQLGCRFGITKSQVLKIEQKAIRKLRHSSRADILKPFADKLPNELRMKIYEQQRQQKQTSTDT